MGARSVEQENSDDALIAYYLENPEALYTALMEEENGAELLGFLSVVSDENCTVDSVLSSAKQLLSEDDYATLELQTDEIQKNAIIINESRAIDTDKKAHFFAGAGVALVAASLIYATTPIAVPGKITAAAAVAVATGVAAGALKELYDYVSGKGVVDVNDFWATGLGAAVGGVVVVGVGSVVTAFTFSTTGAAIICGVLGGIFSYYALQYNGNIIK